VLWYLRNEASFGSEFSQCDFDFSLEYFEPRLMEYLFCKHETLLDSSVDTLGEHNYLGVVLGNVVWPKESAEVELRCWHWNYDSTRLLRQTKMLTIPIPKERMKIRDLPVYPLRFAHRIIKGKLVLRGQQFWSLRYPTQVVYMSPNSCPKSPTEPPGSGSYSLEAKQTLASAVRDRTAEL